MSQPTILQASTTHVAQHFGIEEPAARNIAWDYINDMEAPHEAPMTGLDTQLLVQWLAGRTLLAA